MSAITVKLLGSDVQRDKSACFHEDLWLRKSEIDCYWMWLLVLHRLTQIFISGLSWLQFNYNNCPVNLSLTHQGCLFGFRKHLRADLVQQFVIIISANKFGIHYLSAQEWHLMVASKNPRFSFHLCRN